MQTLKRLGSFGRASARLEFRAELGSTRQLSSSLVNDHRTDQETLYDILGVPRTSSILSIKAAFRKVRLITSVNLPTRYCFDIDAVSLVQWYCRRDRWLFFIATSTCACSWCTDFNIMHAESQRAAPGPSGPKYHRRWQVCILTHSDSLQGEFIMRLSR